jgi:hypothetical protein
MQFQTYPYYFILYVIPFIPLFYMNFLFSWSAEQDKPLKSFKNWMSEKGLSIILTTFTIPHVMYLTFLAISYDPHPRTVPSMPNLIQKPLHNMSFIEYLGLEAFVSIIFYFSNALICLLYFTHCHNKLSQITFPNRKHISIFKILLDSKKYILISSAAIIAIMLGKVMI